MNDVGMAREKAIVSHISRLQSVYLTWRFSKILSTYFIFDKDLLRYKPRCTQTIDNIVQLYNKKKCLE